MEWYYNYKGAVKGPLSDAQLLQVFLVKQYPNNMLVWRSGYEDWIPFYKTELSDRAMLPSSPPPVDVKTVSAGYMWFFVTIPIISLMLKLIIVNIMAEGNVYTAQIYLRLGKDIPLVTEISALLFVMTIVLDANRLIRARLVSRWILLSVLLPPIYPFIRALKLKQPPYYGFAYIVTLFVAILLELS